MKIAVVILNWNGAKLLEQYLPSVIQNSAEASVYVADNASTDNSVVFMKTHFPSVQLIENKANFGFAQGYNEALQHINADIFALVNSDVEVTPNWLSPIIAAFEKNPQVAIVQPKILDYKNKERFEYAGAAGGFLDQYGYPFCRGRIFEAIEKDEHQYDDNCEIFWASGACFFIRSSVFKALGGFDTDFFAHQEEIDLCWRAFNKGHRVHYISESVVYHVGGATLQHGNTQKTFLNFRNSLLMLTKNLPKSELYKILFIRLVLDGIAGIQFILKGQFAHCLAIVRAHYTFFKVFSKNYRKRDKICFEKYYLVKSIVVAHYLQRKMTFKNLF